MELGSLLSIISNILLTVGVVGTVITIIMFLITVIFNIKIMNRTVILLSMMFIFIWIIQIGCSSYLLLSKNYSTPIAAMEYKITKC